MQSGGQRITKRVFSCMIYLGGAVQRQRVDVELSLDGVHGVELHVEEKKDKSVQSRAQAITQSSDACYHALDDACGSQSQSHHCC